MAGEGRATRFERVVLVLSGGGALAAYQAGAYAALANAGLQPDWVAGSATGAANAAIIAGNPPVERAARLRRFWRSLGELAAAAPTLPPPGAGWRSRLAGLMGGPAVEPPAVEPPSGLDLQRLRALLGELVDFDRINASVMRLSLGAIHLPTGVEVAFDNDRHRLTLDHLMASLAAPPRFPPGWIDGEPYGGDGLLPATPLRAVLEQAPPADTLCLVVDGFDPQPDGRHGLSRTRQHIADYRRRQELRRAVHLLGRHVPAEQRRDAEVQRALAQGSNATMRLVHLVHESSAVDLAIKTGDFTAAATARRWQAGERDMAASLARPAWLSPPPRRLGVVVHEMRGGASTTLG